MEDPDRQGLPPHVQLPDRAKFKCGQLRAMMVVNFITLAGVLVVLYLAPEHHTVIAWCAAVIAVVTLVSAVRYGLARARLNKDLNEDP